MHATVDDQGRSIRFLRQTLNDRARNNSSNERWDSEEAWRIGRPSCPDNPRARTTPLVTFGLLAGIFFLATSGVALAQSKNATRNWPQFLGPDRNGISSETGLIDRFPETGPVELWRVPGGVGMSGLALSDGRLVTLVQKEGDQRLLSLNATTGETHWEQVLAPEYMNGMGNGPRATPAIAEGMIFSYTGEGVLTAVNFADGKVVWSKNAVADLKGNVADYGMASSPLVVDQLVFVTVGAPKATVAAYEVGTGKLAWTSGDDPAGYSSPALLSIGGQKQLVVYSGASILGMRPETGAVLWRHPYETNFDCNVVTPLAVKDRIFVSSGENHGSVMLGLVPKGDKFDVLEIWKSQGTKSVLRNEWQTSIYLDGFLYGFDNVGAAGPVTHLTCINAATGERVWQRLRFGKGNLIAADGKLFMSTLNGEIIIARATTTGYEELGRAQVLNSTRTAPALLNGLIYLRDNEEIVCLDVRKQ
jgi:outer membrane protein assembly factor BamB